MRLITVTLLALLSWAGAASAQSNGPWYIIPYTDVSAYRVNSNTGESYDCVASYTVSTRILKGECRPLSVHPGTITPGKGRYVPALMPRYVPGGAYVWFINPESGAFFLCNHTSALAQVCVEGVEVPR